MIMKEIKKVKNNNLFLLPPWFGVKGSICMIWLILTISLGNGFHNLEELKELIGPRPHS
jgi:hypothetical protein